MFAFFGGASSKTKFTDAPTSGKPTLPVGTGTFNGGATPDFQSIAAIGLNMKAGYASDLINLQIAGSTKFRIGSDGLISASSTITSNGNVITTGGNVLLTGAFGTGIVITPISYGIIGFSDHTVIVNAASLTITLPAASARVGYIFIIKNTSLATSTTVASAEGLIDGGITDTTSLVSALSRASYQSDGTNWWRIA